ncbi:high mobility group nucleosome-binding domain-containing protein 3-like [Protopterus annectens]|uniref:high mobility group nucleosome-binding domain-containing protein 3-like n=1 Tax=Protopterus annectens TaxID=7888 RepID=UPI001CFAAFAF|nr:high mobility group nucleosome-binding domain-containing protein 3-like [Protopterus annectens]
MLKRKSPEGTEGKDSAKVNKQEPKQHTRRSAKISAKPAPPKPDCKPKKPAAKKEVAAAKGKKGARGKKEDKPEATPAKNGETKSEEAQKTEDDK